MQVKLKTSVGELIGLAFSDDVLDVTASFEEIGLGTSKICRQKNQPICLVELWKESLPFVTSPGSNNEKLRRNCPAASL